MKLHFNNVVLTNICSHSTALNDLTFNINELLKKASTHQ